MAGPQVTMDASESLIRDIQGILGASMPMKWLSERRSSKATKVLFTDWRTDNSINSPSELIAQSSIGVDSKFRVCIIENISAEYIEALGSAWNIDAQFFATHATNPDRSKLWLRKEWDWNPPYTPLVNEEEAIEPTQSTICDISPFLQGDCDYLDGIFEYNNESPNLDPSTLPKLSTSPNIISRHCFKDSRWPKESRWPIQSNTRISYCRPDALTYLFLVDAPVKFPYDILDKNSRSFPTLRFPNSTSRGGVELPRLLFEYQDRHSVFESLKIFCQHSWHRDALFGLYSPIERTRLSYTLNRKAQVIPAYPFIYLWTSCLWEENLKRLKKDIKRISFREIRDPKLEINSELHDRREDLASLRDGLTETSTWAPPSVRSYFRCLAPDLVRDPIEHLKHLAMAAAELQGFLMETFQLFMSSISVQDSRLSLEQSRLSIEQARRGSRLTLLAFVYVPLSFVTGIFGMNIQQINSSGLNISACFIVAAVAGFVTLLLFWLVKLYGDWNQENLSLSQKILSLTHRAKPEREEKMV